jgi:hypothetical protein
MGRIGLTSVALGAALLGFATSSTSAALSVTGVGAFSLPAGGTGAAELSGITWAGGTQYYAVADSGAGLFPVSISINSTTGAITAATLSPKVTLAGGVDVEGVAYDAASNSVFVSDETGPAIRRHNLTTGALIANLTVPAIYANIRGNFGLESLTRNAAGVMWTANEEALSVDGPTSTFGGTGTANGTWVRLQKFDAALAPAGQWAYRTDSIRADAVGITRERSGVSDLLVLPDGRLIVLERELGGSPIPDFRDTLYLVDFTGATDVSSLGALASGGFSGVTKTALWTGFSFNNYEGIALGPQLANGDYVLVLVSDNGDGISGQNLQTLRISNVPEPTGALFIGTAMALLSQLGRRRQPADHHS